MGNVIQIYFLLGLNVILLTCVWSQVLDSCQKQEASRPPGAGRFSCSTSDVLSCIMHVISKGCIRRNEENLHIVEFLPEDPSTPQKGQAQFSFSQADVSRDAAAAESRADIRCDL